MTNDDLAKGGVGLILTLFGGAVVWLTKTVLGNKEDIKLLEAKVENIERSKITKDGVREVVETALNKHEVACHARQLAGDELNHYKMREIVKEELEKALPKFLDEMRGRVARSNDSTQPINPLPRQRPTPDTSGD